MRSSVPSGGHGSDRVERGQAKTDAAVAGLGRSQAGCADLLAEVAGIMVGASEGRLDEPLSKAAAQLCIGAATDESLIPDWVEEGRSRVAIRR